MEHRDNFQSQPQRFVLVSNNRTSLKRTLVVAAILLALLLGLVVLLLIDAETGPIALLTGLVLAALPVPVYVSLLLWIDRYEAEPTWMLATAFFWGAFVAVFVAYVVNTAAGGIVYLLTKDQHAGEVFSTLVSAPFTEECAKGFVILMLFFKTDEFDDVLDGIVYAGMVGLGFAMMENVQYYGKAALAGEGGVLTGTLILRGGLSPFVHPLLTSMTGIGLGLARTSTKRFVQILAPLIGFALAILLHAVWNSAATLFGSAGFLLTYFLLMVPVFVATLVTIYFALRREGRLLREHLLCDCDGGVMTVEEYESLCSVSARMNASWQAFMRGGFKRWRTRAQFNQTASELAFHRSRVMRGIHPTNQTDAERETMYMEALRDLQRRLNR
ncbi:MAG: PrsW family intramembrane metalloprotease [Pyrinomonadaceae bacterium]